MSEKYYNDAIIGNKSITASYSEKGQLLRLYYPTVDYRQFIDFFYTGVKVNNGCLIYLHNDVNNTYNQYYTEKTNILNTEITNSYFKLKVNQIDFIPINKNVLVKKYTFTNDNTIDLELKFLIHSKIISEGDNSFGSKVLENGMLQYNHNYNMCTFSKTPIWKYQLNEVGENIITGNLEDTNYIGMSEDSAVGYNLGILKPGESTTLEIYLYMNIGSDNQPDTHINESIKDIEKLKKIDYNKELTNTKRYWVKYLNQHDAIKIKEENKQFEEKLRKIYERTILLFPLLTNNTTGGMSAAVEVDEAKIKSGGYSYCWTRDAVFVTQAFDKLKMTKETEKFYKVFCKNTQNKQGMWEQRFYTNCNLAPCWGYQIDETASVVYGVYEHYKHTKNAKFLKDTLVMCENAIKFLNKYIENLIGLKDEEDLVKQEIEDKYKTYDNIYNKPSHDLWEMTEGVHLYSLSSIFGAYSAMIQINGIVEEFFKENRVKLEDLRNSTERLERYRREVKKYILNNLCIRETKTLRRNTQDNLMDVSIIGSVVPFDVFTPKEKKTLNTVDKINMTLRTYTNGYLRFENDTYMDGKYPWTITTMWMGLYYKKVGDKEKVRECLEFIVNTASEHGLLAEQVNNDTLKPEWVIGLGWAHAMFINLIS